MRKRDRLEVWASAEELARWRRSAEVAGAPSFSAFVRDRLDAQPATLAGTTVDPENEARSELWSDSELARNLALIAAGGRRA